MLAPGGWPRGSHSSSAASVSSAPSGAWLNARIAGPVILLLSGVLMLLVALRMAVGHRTRVPTATPEAPGAVRWPVPATGFGVGRLTGFFGVGGGFLIVPALMLILGLPMRLAVGTSLVVIAINAAGTVAHAGRGGVDAAVAVPFVTGGVVGAMLGGRIAAHVNESALARGFAALLRSLAST